ncbi:hypothetical protein EDB89DRAFT_2066021 [Lactarius sanguifluus]|nr:hypothetical protein EDB89DRAFT_2066021 [Lactarius sanguifluus]
MVAWLEAARAHFPLTQSKERPYRTALEFINTWLKHHCIPMPVSQANALLDYLGDYPSHGDLAVFMNKYRTDAPYATYEFEQIGDDELPDKPNEEANVDLQLDYMTDQENVRYVPQTISTSYDGSEQDFSEDYAFACRDSTKLSVRGVGVIFASGDDTVGPKDCRAIDNSGRVQFLPTFPTSFTCRIFISLLTSVGGTINYGSEVVTPFSSGGFSNYFKRPEFQKDAVPPFLQNLGDKYQGLYNATRRRRTTSCISSKVKLIPSWVRAALRLWVLLSSPSTSSVLEHPADRLCTGRSWRGAVE